MYARHRPGTQVSGPSKLQVTDRDQRLLRFAAEHRFVLAEQVSVLLRVAPAAAEARLRSLARAGLLRRRTVFHREPALNWITHEGLGAIGSDLQPPRLDLHSYEHDVGVAWLWLAAGNGAFGPADRVIGERRLRSVDGRREPGQQPLAVRLGGYGPAGEERLHYPDLLLFTPEGKRIALELELTSKGRLRRERILGGYGADSRIDAVVYLVTDRGLGRRIVASAEKVGISPRVYVQLVRSTVRTPDGGATAVPERRRAAEPGALGR